CVLCSRVSRSIAHSHQVHLVSQNMDDFDAGYARLNYIGDKIRVSASSPMPFTDNNAAQNVGFLNLPNDQSTLLHRDITSATSIPAAPPDNTNTPQTAFIGAAYNGAQDFAVSPDTPVKPTPDDSSYDSPNGGVLSRLTLQVVGSECGNSLSMDLDDGIPNPQGSHTNNFTATGPH